MNRRLIAVVLCVMAACALPAGAEPPSDVDRARELTDRGVAEFAAGRYEEAIEAYKSAFALSPHPALLFNIGLAYHRKRDCEHALEYYQHYLEQVPQLENRPKFEARVAEAERCAQARPATAAPAPAPSPVVVAAPASSPTTPSPLRAPVRTGRRFQVAALVGGAIALGSLGAAVYFSVDGAQASEQISRLFERGGKWQAHHEQEIDERGRRDNVAAAALYGVAGAALAGSAVLFGLDRRSRAAARLSLGPTSGGAMIQWAGHF
jgi:tetratricopeptide (TPR) repeat protein